ENTNTIQNPKELLIYINSYKAVLLSTKKPYRGVRGFPQQGQNLKTIVGYSHSEHHITTLLTV
ncbi:hypothetical protein ACLQ96_10455, partial [Ornithobacterium rhinotracheale]